MKENVHLEISDCDSIARPEYWPGYKCFYIIYHIINTT